MKALQLIAQRLILLAVVLLIVSVLTFAIVNILPGDVANAILGDLGTPAQVVALRKQMGLDLPLATRYGTWIVGLLHGNFGRSLQFGVPIGPMLMGRLRNSAILGGLTLLIAVPSSVLLGVLAGVRQGRVTDRVVSGFAIAAFSLPEYVIGLTFDSGVQHLVADLAGQQPDGSLRRSAQPSTRAGAAGRGPGSRHASVS